MTPLVRRTRRPPAPVLSFLTETDDPRWQVTVDGEPAHPSATNHA